MIYSQLLRLCARSAFQVPKTGARFRIYGSGYSKRFIARTAGGRPYLYSHQIRRDHPLP
jgi:hypothetical protein